jgi:hypothetical protein
MAATRLSRQRLVRALWRRSTKRFAIQKVGWRFDSLSCVMAFPFYLQLNILHDGNKFTAGV